MIKINILVKQSRDIPIYVRLVTIPSAVRMGMNSLDSRELWDVSRKALVKWRGPVIPPSGVYLV